MLPSYATTNVVTSEPSAFVNGICRLLKISDIAPEVCKSISELEPSAFKKGICAVFGVPIVTVSLPELPVILIKPDCAKVNVSVALSAATILNHLALQYF